MSETDDISYFLSPQTGQFGGELPNSKDEPQDPGLQRTLTIQVEILASVLGQVIVDLRQVSGHRENVFPSEKLPDPDCLLTKYVGLLSPCLFT